MQLPEKKAWPFIGAALIVGIAIASLVGYIVWTKANAETKRALSENKTLQDLNQNLRDYNQQIQTPPPTPEPTPDNNQPTPKVESDITWNNKPTLLKSDLVDFYIRNSLPDTTNFAVNKETETIIIGKFSSTSTAYPDWSVLRAYAYDELGMGTYPVFKLFALSPDKQIIMPWNGDLPASSDFPKQLTLPNGKTVKQDYYENDNPAYEGGTNCLKCAALGGPLNNETLITTKEGVKIYRSGRGAFTFDKFGQGVFYYDNLSETSLKDIQWSITNPPSTQYESRSSGCGGNLPDITTDTALGAVHEVGTLPNGDKIYAPIDLKNNELVKLKYDYWFPDYNYLDTTTKKPSFDTFLQEHPLPLFVWKNAFDTWFVFSETSLAPAAECGKPVIYLYPEKDTNVSVRLPSKINVTVSEPTYPKNGWNVLAKPDGSLLYKDGKTYGSLFWEGTGVSYTTPKQGFIVKDSDVTNFLATTLPKYGLNPTETKEFMDFWVPLFKGAPYYRISFLTSDWSKAAPLNVSPAPQTQIRIFMDWSPLAGPINIIEPTITTPKRNGFTLVEWGGLLRK